MTKDGDRALRDLLSLDLEYRLTVAHFFFGEGCEECAQYLITRREVLLPAVIEQANKNGEDPTSVFHGFAQRMHARHDEERSK